MAFYPNYTNPQWISPNQLNTGNTMYAVNPQINQPYPNYSTQQPNTPNGIIWVQGEVGAKAYPVAPGNRVLLMDSENPVIYIKSTDASGRPMDMEVYDMVKRESTDKETSVEAVDNHQSEYIRRDEIDEIIEAKAKEFMKRDRNKKGDHK